MQKGLVSVVIPNYNYAHYLREAVDSVLAQTYPDIEIIAVDDGSTDGSREVIQSYGQRITAVLQQNQGVAAARNNGVAIGKGEFVAFLDADDAWMPEKIERQISAFSQDENLGLVHVAVEEINERGDAIRTVTCGLEGNVSSDLLRFDRAVILGGGSGLMVTRAVFDEVGGFDEELSTSADWDLFYRISSRYSVGFVSETLLRYRIHSSNMHGNITRMEAEMLRGFEKAFAAKPDADAGECYANLYRTLAGSYFYAGRYADFARTTAKSIGHRPANIAYFLKYPIRRFKRS